MPTLIEGKVVIAAANPDVMENYIEEHDMVILGNRYEVAAVRDRDAGGLYCGMPWRTGVPGRFSRLAEETATVRLSVTPHRYLCGCAAHQSEYAGETSL